MQKVMQRNIRDKFSKAMKRMKGKSKDIRVVISGTAMRETASVGDRMQRRLMKGVDDLDFFFGDGAVDKTNCVTIVISFDQSYQSVI
ncbi:hypothetical protein cypCar_00026954 [Cyprinus carpio]|nr:hypothetical protein cypCar_00026954 [Cyprinus carpio]